MSQQFQGTPQAPTTSPDIQTTSQPQYPTQGSAAMMPQPSQTPQHQAQVIPFPTQPQQAPPLPQQGLIPTPSYNGYSNQLTPQQALLYQGQGNPYSQNLQQPYLTPEAPFPQVQQMLVNPGMTTPTPASPYSQQQARLVQQLNSPQAASYLQTFTQPQLNPVQSGVNSSIQYNPQYNPQPNVSAIPSSVSSPLQRQEQAHSQRVLRGELPSNEEIYAHFGQNAPEILNESHTNLEDAYNQQAQILSVASEQLKQTEAIMEAFRPHLVRYQQMEAVLNDPNLLSSYTIDYLRQFPHIQEYEAQQAQMQQAYAQLPQEQFMNPTQYQAAYQSANYNGQQSFQLPPMESYNYQQPTLENVRPDELWRYTDQLERQGLLRNKVLISA